MFSQRTQDLIEHNLEPSAAATRGDLPWTRLHVPDPGRFLRSLATSCDLNPLLQMRGMPSRRGTRCPRSRQKTSRLIAMQDIVGEDRIDIRPAISREDF